MSVVSMSTRGSNGRAGGVPGAAAALHVQEGHSRLVIARRGERWEVVEARTLGTADAATLAPLFEQHGVTRVVRIVPARESIARSVVVAGGDDAAMAGAATLLAEAELPAALEPYRRAAGVLPEAGGSESRTALLTGWTNAGAVPSPVSEVPETWVSPVAALALLRGDAGRAAVYAEAGEGVICVLVPGAEKAVARVLMEQPGTGDEWSQRVAKAVEETGQIAGVPGTAIQTFLGSARGAGNQRLLLESMAVSGVRARLGGVRDDRAWLDDYGLAIGAVLVATSELASVRGLAGLHAEKPREQLSPVEAATQWIARPRHAWAVIAAALALMLLLPMGLAYGRSVMLQKRTDKLKDLKVGREGLEKRAAMYAQLESVRWPMTKIMADISAATPVGVTITGMLLTAGQPASISGTADSPELLSKLQTNLNASRVFSNIRINRQDAKGSGIDFDISARVSPSVHVPVKLTDDTDFAKKPLAVRLYGEGASNTAGGSGGEHASSGGEHGRRRERGGGADRAEKSDKGEKADKAEKGEKEGSRRTATTASDAVPPPLSDADIAKLTNREAMREFSNRKSYIPKHPNLDAATKQRLTDEWMKCKEQMDKTRGTAAAPAPGATPATAPAAGAAPAAPAGTPPATPPATTPAPAGGPK